MKKKKTAPEKKKELIVRGIPASPGIAIGPAFLYAEPSYTPEIRLISRKRVPTEIKRFREAIRASQNYLSKIKNESPDQLSQEYQEILQTQIDILNDDIFLKEVEQLIQDELYDAPYATYKVFRKKMGVFQNLPNEYFRDRALDIQNLKRLILRHLLGKKLNVILKDKSIIVTDNLSPADTIRLHHHSILGFCTNFGGKNSHTAIIARSLGVPAVVGTEIVTTLVSPGDELIVDGSQGVVIIHPTPETKQEYEQKQKKFILIEKSLLKEASLPARTKDGHKVKVYANIEFIEELEAIRQSGAEGIGLYRTEGLFMGGNGLPSEEQQFRNYLEIARAFKEHSVVIRTLDVGGDKIMPDFVTIPERNPFLGWRAIRFCLDHKEIFLPQLKAILRANQFGNLKILLPMVSSLEEIEQFQDVFQEAQQALKAENQSFNPDIEIGIMVEIPSAALLAEHFARKVDFFSIGTNDLIQYTLAVDRANEKISHLYNHFHPAVIQLIKHVIDVGKEQNIPVSMCGEMAGDPVATPLLLGLGLDRFSAVHSVIPEIKQIIRNVSLKECEQLAQQALTLVKAEDVQKLCENFYAKHFSVSTELKKPE